MPEFDNFETTHDYEASPLAEVPRLPGDEIDDARLIVKLHHAIELETGRFGLPWYQRPQIRALGVACLLLVVSVVSLQVGVRKGQGTLEGQFNRDPAMAALFREVDAAYAEDPDPEAWLNALDLTIDVMADQHRQVESAHPFGEPLYGLPSATGTISTSTQQL